MMMLYIAGIILTGVAIYHLNIGNIAVILGKGRGAEAVGSLLDADIDLTENALSYAETISRTVFAGIGMNKIFIISALAVLITLLYTKRSKSILTTVLSPQNALWLVLLGLCVSYLMMISQISPYEGTYRYISYITPMVTLIFTVLIIRCLQSVNMRAIYSFFIISIPCVLLIFSNISSNNVIEYLFSIDEERERAIEPYYNLPVICITHPNHIWEVTNSYWYLFEFNDKVMFTLEDSPNEELMSEISLDNGLILFTPIRGRYNVPTILYEYSFEYDFNNVVYITEFNRHQVYYLSP